VLADLRHSMLWGVRGRSAVLLAHENTAFAATAAARDTGLALGSAVAHLANSSRAATSSAHALARRSLDHSLVASVLRRFARGRFASIRAPHSGYSSLQCAVSWLSMQRRAALAARSVAFGRHRWGFRQHEGREEEWKIPSVVEIAAGGLVVVHAVTGRDRLEHASS